jgi:hypothetical protein
LNHSIYLVWYKNNRKSAEKAAGFAYTWNHAKQMAEGLYAIKKKVDKQSEAITGISLFDCGELYTVKQPNQKWQILPIMVVMTSSIVKIKE